MPPCAGWTIQVENEDCLVQALHDHRILDLISHLELPDDFPSEPLQEWIVGAKRVNLSLLLKENRRVYFQAGAAKAQQERQRTQAQRRRQTMDDVVATVNEPQKEERCFGDSRRTTRALTTNAFGFVPQTGKNALSFREIRAFRHSQRQRNRRQVFTTKHSRISWTGLSHDGART